ncbi:TPA: DUF4127 family protein [Salmonella enterica subsp. enterica serovar Typhi str. AG3]|nr:DUF4127 family protein [Salmonella enterica subsp. enterica serovar Typhi str. AG3]
MFKKSKKKSLFATALAATLLASSFVGTTGASAAIQGPVTPNKTVMLVPLDDRPMNTDTVVKAAAASGIKIIMPPKDIIDTKLDDQYDINDSGDTAALLNWIRANDHLADGYIFSADQIHSGGLVESRNMHPKVSLTQGTANLDIIKEVDAANPGKPIYVFDSVMRLASTNGYDGLSLSDYNEYRAFGKQPRDVFSSSFQGVIDGYDNYLNSTGIVPRSGTGYSLTETEVQNYYAAKERKFRLNKAVVDRASYADYIVFGVDDSSPDNNVQLNEVNWLKYQTNNSLLGKSKVVSDIDGTSLALLARMTKTLYNQPALKYYIDYYGLNLKSYSYQDEYGFEQTHERLKNQIDITGGIYSGDAATSDIHIVGLSPDATSTNVSAAVSAVNTKAASNIPTVLLDLTKSPGSLTMIDNVLASGNASRLLSYSAWNTLGNRMGIAFGIAGARMNFMKSETNATELRDASKSFASLSIDRIVKDREYKAVKRASLDSWIINNFEPNPDTGNLRASGLSSYDLDRIDNQLQVYLQPSQDRIEAEFKGHAILESVGSTSGSRTNTKAYFDSVPAYTDADVSLPWLRTFEAQMDSSKATLY